MIDVAKLSAKGQIVIPGDIRKKLRIKQGSKLVLRQIGRRLVIIPERDFETELLQQEQEDKGWLKLAEKSLEEVWSKETDEEWSQYL